MAFKAYRPYKPDFRTVTRARGRTAEPRSIAQKPPQLDPMKSIYAKDFNRGQNNTGRNVGTAQPQAFNPYNPQSNPNLRE